MAAFCEHIKQDVLPRNEGVQWDHLRVEFWSDSGRMIVFPSSTLTGQRIEKAGCQVVFSDLLNEYEALADSELDDDAFVAALLRLEERWIKSFVEGARKVGLSGIRIEFWDGDGERAICEKQI